MKYFIIMCSILVTVYAVTNITGITKYTIEETTPSITIVDE